ncbi:MAG: hypothetical protein ACREHG_09585 [Candidatus Saccharimonadales bacterium]
MAHSVNLAAKHFIEAVCPTPRHLLRKRAHATCIANEEDEEDEEDEEEDKDKDDDTEQADPIVTFEAGDTLGKLLAIINQVRLASLL